MSGSSVVLAGGATHNNAIGRPRHKQMVALLDSLVFRSVLQSYFTLYFKNVKKDIDYQIYKCHLLDFCKPVFLNDLRKKAR